MRERRYVCTGGGGRQYVHVYSLARACLYSYNGNDKGEGGGEDLTSFLAKVVASSLETEEDLARYLRTSLALPGGRIRVPDDPPEVTRRKTNAVTTKKNEWGHPAYFF